MSEWQRIGATDPRALAGARLQLHWAAQAAAGVGRTLRPSRPDDSQTSFTWSDGALLQEPVHGRVVALRVRDLTLLVNGTASLSLRGHTLDEAFAFLERAFGHPLNRPNVALPDHPVAHGARFDAEDAHLEELARYYAGAAAIIPAEPIRCWPHHFDLAALVEHGQGRTTGIGLSPGDAAIAEPYFYVTPWPYPDASALGTLRFGRWNTEGWVGAVLPGSEFAGVEAQEERVRAFLQEAIERVQP